MDALVEELQQQLTRLPLQQRARYPFGRLFSQSVLQPLANCHHSAFSFAISPSLFLLRYFSCARSHLLFVK
jgi:hypothetical protein